MGLALCGSCLVMPVGEAAPENVFTAGVAQAKTGTMVKDFRFTMSPSEFQSRIDAAFDGLCDVAGARYTTVMSKEASKSGSTLALWVKRGTKNMARIQFTLVDRDDYWLDYSDRGKANSFDEVFIIFADDTDQSECQTYTSLALIMALDSALDGDEVMTLAYDLANSFEYTKVGLGYGMVKENGISYTMMESDGTWALVADCSA